MKADIKQMKKDLYLEELTDDQVVGFLRQMSLPCDVVNGKLQVKVPITRSDIMHQCDLVEDLAIAYGYNNLKADVPQTLCLGSEQPLNHLTELLRHELAGAGFNECLTFGLVRHKENFENLRREPIKALVSGDKPHEYNHGACPVRLSNPKTKEFEIARTSLIPGVMMTLAYNKKNPPPLHLFEVSDTVVL